ncbi:hypothetical protein [Streptomyces sp. NRRL B-1347]|uniref:hypothetical protein n=1 Tax=Streptomyces sp. NRRL B-1347 TaxID=1476877 RepID=UPI0004C957B7|nr:hypothetical protein [Streptomyces sp. NRRL B-1347]
MTRAQALALRAAGTLDEDCVIVITDGPTIGTAGNTSATEIELNPTGPSEFGTAARVHTAFDDSAWVGTFDIDLGTAGSITRLTDAFGNTAVDTDADAPTVHTQWPWHRGSTTFRDNRAENVTLPGWDVATAPALNNTLRRTTLDNSGNWTISGNTIDGGSTVNTVTLGSSAGAARSMTNNTIVGGAVIRDNAGGAGTRFISTSTFRDGYVLDIAATNTSNVSISGSTFEGHSTQPTDAEFDGAGTRTIDNCRVTANRTAQQFTLHGTGGVVALNDSEFPGGRVVRDPAATANLSIAAGTTLNGVVTQAAGATSGALSVSNSVLQSIGTVLTQNGPGAVTVQDSYLIGGSAANSASATRGLTVQSSTLQSGTVQQNRTGGTGADSVLNSYVEGQGNCVTFNGAADPGGSQTLMNSVRVTGLSSLALTDPVGSGGPGAVVMQATEITAGTDVTGPAGVALVTDCRFSGGAVVNLGAFGHQNTIIEGAFTRTLNAANVNRLLNKAFDDVLGV